MSDTNRVGVSIAKSNERTAPITLAPNELTALRITGTPNLGFVPETVVSNELRPDRQIADSILVGAEAGGDIGFELSFGAFDSLIESAKLSTWQNAPRRTGSSEITAFGVGAITVDDASAFRADHVVRLVAPSAGVVGDGVYVIDSIATNVLTVSPWSASTNAVTASFAADASTLLVVCGVRSNAAGDFDMTVSGTVASIDATGSSDFDNLMGAASELAVGQWIKIHGFTTAGNNVYARVASQASTALTFDAPTGAATEATGDHVTLFFGDYVRNGSDAIASHQYCVERRFEDHSPVTREQFLGMAINSLGINLQPKSIATGSVTMVGFNSTAGTTVSNLYSGGTPTDIAAPQFDVYNTSSNIGRLGRGTDPVATQTKNFVLEASVLISNNLRSLAAVGVFGAAAIGVGEFSVTGNLNTYFDDDTLLNLLLNNTETSYDFAVKALDGRTMLFDLPRIKFTSGAPDVPGKNQDTVINLGFQALLSSVLGYTMHTQRMYYTA